MLKMFAVFPITEGTFARRSEMPKKTRADLIPPVEVEDLYSPEYLKDCADEEARQGRLEELKRRIELGAYKVDPDSVALHMMGRVDLDE